MDLRLESIILETDRWRIEGQLTLPAEGYRSRLSDFLNRSDRDFIPLTNVELSPLNGGPPSTREFLAVSRPHVQLAFPYDGEADS